MTGRVAPMTIEDSMIIVHRTRLAERISYRKAAHADALRMDLFVSLEAIARSAAVIA